jgi:D-alanyl-D-alanine carboxypeptidase (penicillin-binding protein 5/6)
MVAGMVPVSLAATSKKTATPKKTGSSHIIARNPYVGAIVVEAASGKVLFEDQADAKGYPASMLKLMDLLIILEKVEQGQLSLQDHVPVSAKAANAAPSNVGLAEKESFPLDEMLYALMIRSANDAAIAVAEKVGGSTDGFIELMNKRAKELGMSSTVFHSVNGLPPAAGQEHDITTARDFSLLCREVLKHKAALRYTSTRERVFRPNAGKRTVNMRNHNHLLWNLEGCDGLKTGFITAAGFSVAVTASHDGHRVIAIVLDSIDAKTRDSKAAELIGKGFAALGVQVSKGHATVGSPKVAAKTRK